MCTSVDFLDGTDWKGNHIQPPERKEVPMLRLYVWLTQRAQDETGATAVEYGLLAALIAVVMAVGAAFLGERLSALFDWIGSQL